MRRLKYFLAICVFIYGCAILIDTNLNPLEWSEHLRIFVVFLLVLSGYFCMSVDFDDKPRQKCVEEQIFDKIADQIDWEAEIKRGK
jgi:hypothetical protein